MENTNRPCHMVKRAMEPQHAETKMLYGKFFSALRWVFFLVNKSGNIIRKVYYLFKQQLALSYVIASDFLPCYSIFYARSFTSLIYTTLNASLSSLR